MRVLLTLFLAASLFIQDGWASDACAGRAIFTTADVQVSNGKGFKTETWFSSADTSAIRHIQEEDQVVAVEGPVAWISRGDKSRAGGDQLASFALGHQFHAMFLHFEEMASGIKDRADISFAGETYPGKSGMFKYGGKISLVTDPEAQHPLGILFELPEQAPMEISFSEWKIHAGIALPFHIRINDGKDVYEYSYTRVDLGEKPLNWFSDSVAAPDIDELLVYRLHRTLLTAHCSGDADVIAELTAPETIVSGRGELRESSREETRSRFQQVFQQLDYTEYHDLKTPTVEVSESGDIGWIAVNVLAVGKEIASNKPFESQWSWVMLTRKIDGVWLNAGNASNNK